MEVIDFQHTSTLGGGDPLAVADLTPSDTPSMSDTLDQLLNSRQADGLLVAGGAINMFENMVETIRDRSVFNFMQSAVGMLGLHDDLKQFMGDAETIPTLLSGATPQDITQLLNRAENGEIDMDSLTDGLKEMMADRHAIRPTNAPTPS